jgi:hypothetical protein
MIRKIITAHCVVLPFEALCGGGLILSVHAGTRGRASEDEAVFDENLKRIAKKPEKPEKADG